MKKIGIKNNQPKTSPTRSLESAIAARRKSQTELSILGKLLADKSARQAVLEITGDLNHAAIITELSRLQVFATALPRRIAAKEEDALKAEETLIQATNQFIQEHLGPRVRQLAARTRKLVESELAPHYRERSALTIAVSQSPRVQSIERLAWSTTLQPTRGAMEHAEGALKSWTGVDKFEKTLSPESVSVTQ